MDITAVFEPTVHEIRSALARNGRKNRIISWIYAAVGIVGGAILFVLGLGIGGGPTSAGEAVIGVFLLLFGMFFLSLVRLAKPTIDRIAGSLCKPITLHLQADRYSWQMGERHGEHLWELTRVVVSPIAWTLVFTSNKVNLVLPKRALGDEDVAAFEAFLAGRDRKLVKVV